MRRFYVSKSTNSPPKRRRPPERVVIWMNQTGKRVFRTKFRGRPICEDWLPRVEDELRLRNAPRDTPWVLLEGGTAQTLIEGKQLNEIGKVIISSAGATALRQAAQVSSEPKVAAFWHPPAQSGPARLVMVKWTAPDGIDRVTCFRRNKRYQGRSKEGCALHMVTNGTDPKLPWVLRQGLEDGVELDRGDAIGPLAESAKAKIHG